MELLILSCEMFIIFCVFLFLSHLYARFTMRVTRSNSCLVGKTAIVTGANSGEFFQVLEEMITSWCQESVIRPP
jgi:hypothetical protein